MPRKNPIGRKEYTLKYYQDHKEEILAQKREERQINKDEINAKRRDQYKNDPEYKTRNRAVNRASRLKNKDKIASDRRTIRKRFSIVKSSSKSRGLPCSITKDQYQILIAKPCYYCEDQLATVENSTGIGLDRLDNDKGYELDNVVPCCVICNRARSDHFTPEETKVAIQAVINLRKNKAGLI